MSLIEVADALRRTSVLIETPAYMKSSASESVKNGGNFAFETALIQMPNLSCAEPNA